MHGSRAISLRRSIVVNRNKQVGNVERTENLDPSKKTILSNVYHYRNKVIKLKIFLVFCEVLSI